MKGLRLLTIGLLVGIVAGALIAPSVAGAIGSTVGVVDLDKALASHPDYESRMSTIDAYEKQQRARLDAYRNKSTLTDEDKSAIVTLRVEIDKNVSDKYDELFNPLGNDVLQALTKIGSEYGMDVIIDTKAVLYGGLDLTPAVINELG